jgi:hypothetical protein
MKTGKTDLSKKKLVLPLNSEEDTIKKMWGEGDSEEDERGSSVWMFTVQ